MDDFNSSKEDHASCGCDHFSDKRIPRKWINNYKNPTGQLGLEYDRFELKFDLNTTIMETNSDRLSDKRTTRNS
jgi:hypothetical protein